MFKHYILLLFVLLTLSVNAVALSILRDTEAENVIYEIADPIFKAAKMRPRIYIVMDKDVNAFTAGGEIIFINSGLITKFPNPDVLKGVLAHEMGHVLGKHVAIAIDDSANAMAPTLLSSVAVGVLAAIASHDPSAILFGAMIGGDTYRSNILHYSRAFEASADQTALRLLETSHSTCNGLYTLLQHIYNRTGNMREFQYDMTHPLSQDRMSTIKNFMSHSKYNDAFSSKELSQKYLRVAAKIAAFTDDRMPTNTNDVNINNYYDSIVAMKRSDKIVAMKKIDDLIKQSKNDPFYHELKGQILLAFGDVSSLDSYKTACILLNDNLMKIEYAIAISKLSDNNSMLIKAETILHQAILLNPNDINLMKYLAICYGKQGKTGKSLLIQAKIALASAEFKKAIAISEQVKKYFANGSNEWIQADDISTTAKNNIVFLSH
jgi:predicted Zn-dependent protease